MEADISIGRVAEVAARLERALARRIVGPRFNRIQFTPDLMPSGILGAEVI